MFDPKIYLKPVVAFCFRCLQEYESIRQYYAIFPDEDRETGPQFPNCDSEGRYVTRLCEQTRQNECFCIQPESGEKLVGSDFGGSNSPIQLNCDQCKFLCDGITAFYNMGIKFFLNLIKKII